MRSASLVLAATCACGQPIAAGFDAVPIDGALAVPDAPVVPDAGDGRACLEGTPQVDAGLLGAEVVISHLHNIYALGFNAHSIYVLTWDGLFRASREPCALHLLVEQPVYHFVVDETQVYWEAAPLVAPNTLLAMPALGGPTSPLYQSTGSLERLSLGADAVYVNTVGSLVRVPKDGTPWTRLDGPAVHWSQIAVDATDAYYFYENTPGGDAEDLVRIDPVIGGNRTVVVPNATDVMPAVNAMVDPTHVYWASTQALYRVDRSMPADVGPLVAIQDLLEPPLAQDDDYVYYANNTYTMGAWHGELMRLSKVSLQTDVIGSAEGVFRAIAVDGAYVYFGVGFEGPFEDRKEWVGRLQR